MAFIDELKRRKVVRVVLAYAAAAFVVAQVATTFFPALHLPPWTVTLVVALCVIGLPIAAILAWAFDVQDGAVVRDRRSSSARTALALVGVVAIAIVAAASLWRTRARETPLDAQLIAVLPFRVSGDASLAYLREGMVDLLAPALTLEEGTRAVDPRSVFSEWRRHVDSEETDLPADSAHAIARALGAGRILIGSAVGKQDNLTITAELYTIDDSKPSARAQVIGSADTLQALIGSLTTQLLSLDAGEARARLASLTSTSLDAVKAYLIGQSHFRHARFDVAGRHFNEAVEIDSTFALAALGLHLTNGWGLVEAANSARVRRLIRQYRAKLTAPDREFVDAMLGDTVYRPKRADIKAWERYVEQYPDRADAWFQLGDELVHSGGLAGLSDARQQATNAFNRAIALDSQYLPAVVHLLDQAAIFDRDTARYRRLYPLLERFGESADVAPYQFWTRAAMSADTARLRVVRTGMDTLSSTVLAAITLFSQTGLGSLDDADRAARTGIERAATPADRRTALIMALWLYQNTGRYDDARRIIQRGLDTDDARFWHAQRLIDALFVSGDSSGTGVSAAALAGSNNPLHLCTLGQWQLRRNETVGYPRIAAALRGDGSPNATVCAELLHVLRAAAANRGDPGTALERLDSIAGTGYGSSQMLRQVNMTIAALRDARGETQLALRAVRRFGGTHDQIERYANYLHEDGRLSLANGDTAAAIRAWTRYLELREKAEGLAIPERDQVRARLLTLTRDRSR